ncbi:hypothetical protein [Tateyamaria sp. SN6-1]|uniref:hypothetical protein n=1 Tax=Tateyamaria sp. SN6-1 TaxID=3092148 RepID=UPI0039F49D71
MIRSFCGTVPSISLKKEPDMLAAALILNICVLVPVVAGLTSGARTMELVFGADTNARRILTCVYGAIGMSSVLLLGLLFAGHP